MVSNSPSPEANHPHLNVDEGPSNSTRTYEAESSIKDHPNVVTGFYTRSVGAHHEINFVERVSNTTVRVTRLYSNANTASSLYLSAAAFGSYNYKPVPSNHDLEINAECHVKVDGVTRAVAFGYRFATICLDAFVDSFIDYSVYPHHANSPKKAEFVIDMPGVGIVTHQTVKLFSTNSWGITKNYAQIASAIANS